MLIALFLFIVFAPCVIVIGGRGFGDGAIPDVLYVDKLRVPRRRGKMAIPLQAMLPEASLSEDFEIRSFAKGISQRRIVVRDAEAGVKLTIAQVREAAAELFKLGGEVAAHEFALVVAAAATAMTTVQDAVAVAARRTLVAAGNAYEWLAWHGGVAAERVRGEGPPMSALDLESVMPRWQEASQAA